MKLEEAITEAKMYLESKYSLVLCTSPEAVETLLHAAASGDLIPLADHKLAVALAMQRACDAVEANFPGTLYASNRTKTIDAILALADTDALAEVQELKAERDRWRTIAHNEANSAEAAEAEAIDLRAEVRELKDTIMDLKFELDWIKDRHDV